MGAVGLDQGAPDTELAREDGEILLYGEERREGVLRGKLEAIGGGGGGVDSTDVVDRRLCGCWRRNVVGARRGLRYGRSSRSGQT